MRTAGVDMSTTYTLFTEVQVADKWYCVSPLMRIVDHIIDPAESELALVPTLENNARYHFENANAAPHAYFFSPLKQSMTVSYHARIAGELLAQ